jgi:hypothetical protein
MGYTHYWYFTQFTEADAAGYAQALPVVKDIVRRHRDVLAYEWDQPERPPLVARRCIRLNGRNKDGHETFWFRPPILDAKPGRRQRAVPTEDFTKTAQKPYDLCVSELLLVLKAHLPHLEIDSDGFSAYLDEAERDSLAALDGTWAQAIENVKRYGVTVAVGIDVRRAPYCDLKVEPWLAEDRGSLLCNTPLSA